MIKRLDSQQPDFRAVLKALTTHQNQANPEVTLVVEKILNTVKTEGDSAIVNYTKKLDSNPITTIDEVIISQEKCKQACQNIPPETLTALKLAAKRIETFHQKQTQSSWEYQDEFGNTLGQKVTPLDKVGIYVPGGKASYPSSVLMNAIPAKVAGVKEIIMTVPAPQGNLNELVLAAAHIAGVNKVFTIGGAQAVAALTYGTTTIPAVDKIVGPGNIYVATAKKLVFGEVGIDMIAGPSEILIICDGHTDPNWIAMDLFSQAEHDENAQSILISPDNDYLDKVQAAIDKLLPTMERQKIIKKSLLNKGLIIKSKDLDDAAKITNQIAPEHLELSVEDPKTLTQKIHHAGAIFQGRFSSETLGDYCAGPNHVLPTSGTARFSSPLGVYDFQKRSSIMHMSEKGAKALGEYANTLAQGEDLTAHAKSARYRYE